MKLKLGLIVVAVLLLISLGYGIAYWRNQSRIAGYEAREQQRLEEIKANNAEKDQLRGQNQGILDENAKIREEIASLSAEKAGLEQLVKEHGGISAAEVQKLEQINEQLKNDQDVLTAPTDKCVRCREFSAVLVANRRIKHPLPCTDECSGHNK